MSDLLRRLKAMRGQAPEPAAAALNRGDQGLEQHAARLGASAIEAEDGVHFVKDVHLTAEARYGQAEVGSGGMHPLLLRQAGAHAGGRVLYLDTETTGLSGGAGTLAFLIGVGTHTGAGFHVRQLMLPGPQHERAQLRAFARLAEGASAVVTYNGGSFDLPLLRSRFALHGLTDPLYGVPHLDLLTLARRLWRDSLPDCSLGTVEARILGAQRSLEDVPGFEVPARYLAWLRSRDPAQLSGVLSHNDSDIVAMSALRRHLELLLEEPQRGSARERRGLGLWLERLGETDEALKWLLTAADSDTQAAWHAALLLKRSGRTEEAAELWLELGRDGLSEAWVELAKLHEHRRRDYASALSAVEAALNCADADRPGLLHRRNRLLRRLTPPE